MFTLTVTFTFICIKSIYSESVANLPAVHQITEPLILGEGPMWDSRTSLLYFTDILEGKVLSYDPYNGETFYVKFNGSVSPLVGCRSNPYKFVIGLNKTITIITWDGKHKETEQTAFETKNEYNGDRFNDGKADKRGRLWIGTIGPESKSGVPPGSASFYRLDKSLNEAKIVLPKVTISNGLVWNGANNKMYYIDSVTRRVVEYDFDDESGEISNPKTVIDFRDATGIKNGLVPDGMTIDRDDKLWVALYGGGSVVQIEPSNGKILRRIAIPAIHVTSVMFGGKDLDILFVTTASKDVNDDQKHSYPAAGSLFAITGLGTTGVPIFTTNLC